jgi:hypothetical protein
MNLCSATHTSPDDAAPPAVAIVQLQRPILDGAPRLGPCARRVVLLVSLLVFATAIVLAWM